MRATSDRPVRGVSRALALTLAVACARPTALPPALEPARLVVPFRSDETTNGASGALMRAVPAPAAPGNAAATRPAADSGASDVSQTEIARVVAKVFGDSAPPPKPDPIVAPGTPTWDIDVHSFETRARVAYFVDVFSGRAKAPFEKSLQQQTRYGALIRERLRDGGLPEDLTYLALIESWYDPHAYSKAAAVGMWQFMAGTARSTGLRVDWWVDERRDPVRSTEAAVRLLKSLRDQFGSIYLAAAAYDGGDGRVSRGLARFAGDLDGVEGENRYFTLADTKYLRPETRDYVPKLIAAALVGKEPARYGVTVESLPSFAFDSVRVAGGTPFTAIASAAATNHGTIHDLNPHLLRGMTPPRDTMWVRVVAGAAAGFDERLSALAPAERSAVTRVTSKKGESMTSIAKKQGLTAKQLNWYNPKVVRLKSGNLVAGQAILVPSRATVSAAMDVPNPSIERYPRRSRKKKSQSP